MIKFLLHRPLAVITTLISVIVIGTVLLQKIPVSLLPNIDVPRIVIQANYDNSSADVIEENITQKIRNQLLTLRGIQSVESVSSSHVATLFLNFEYGTRMDLAYVNANESIDRLISALPKDLPRPSVLRINTADVPILRLQLIPKRLQDFSELSELTEKTIRRQLEQIPGVSMVDMSGRSTNVITLSPKMNVLRSIGLTEQDLISAIQSSNSDLGSLSVKDGQYKYYVKVSNKLQTLDQLSSIPLALKNGTMVNLDKLVEVRQVINDGAGTHLYGGKRAIVITVNKQAQSKMNSLVPRVLNVVTDLQREFPDIEFKVTQNQTYLLDAGIQNLTQDIIYGGALCIILLFLFIGNYVTAILMSVNIPISLIITFIFFYLFNLSFNIISLSGLALGVGMVIDNSIIVIDNISRKHREGFSVDDSCISGTYEVMVAVISQVLTTIAIYIPLIFLSGLSGALVYDQAIALTISLFASLLVAFVLNPVLYKLLIRPSSSSAKETFFFRLVSKNYHRMIGHIFKKPKRYLALTVIVMPLGFLLLFFIHSEALPNIEQNEISVTIDWNAPVVLEQNSERVKALLAGLTNIEEWEADIGLTQFLNQETNNNFEGANIYLKCKSSSELTYTKNSIQQWLLKRYPSASFVVKDATNSFTKLFDDNSAFLEARFRSVNKVSDLAHQERLEKMLLLLPNRAWHPGLGFAYEPDIEIRLNYKNMALYNVRWDDLKFELTRQFGNYVVTEFGNSNQKETIEFEPRNSNIKESLSHLIKNKNGESYPLKTFISIFYDKNQKYITSDLSGKYKSVLFEDEKNLDVPSLENKVAATALSNGFSTTFFGKYYAHLSLMRELLVVFVVSVFLLYFILVLQFENFMLPMLVMLTIPLGVSGAMAILWMFGGTINTMSAIGFIIVLGIIVDDPILKVETINRLVKQYKAEGTLGKTVSLDDVIHEAGEICLKPLLLTSLTTSLALVPILFSGGIGNDLQKPMIYVVTGGLSIGTFLTLWFVPLAYKYLYRIQKIDS